jgi:hypothetical protein
MGQEELMPDVVDRNGMNGWVVEKKRSHYSLGYWVSFVLGMLGQTVPSPPRITYTLRNSGSGETRTITLDGDHQPSELAGATSRARTDRVEPARDEHQRK